MFIKIKYKYIEFYKVVEKDITKCLNFLICWNIGYIFIYLFFFNSFLFIKYIAMLRFNFQEMNFFDQKNFSQNFGILGFSFSLNNYLECW